MEAIVERKSSKRETKRSSIRNFHIYSVSKLRENLNMIKDFQNRNRYLARELKSHQDYLYYLENSQKKKKKKKVGGIIETVSALALPVTLISGMFYMFPLATWLFKMGAFTLLAGLISVAIYGIYLEHLNQKQHKLETSICFLERQLAFEQGKLSIHALQTPKMVTEKEEYIPFYQEKLVIPDHVGNVKMRTLQLSKKK